MRWDDFRRSDNVEDVRGDGGFGGGGGGFSLPGGGGGLGIGTIIVLGLLAWALGIDPRVLIGGAEVFTGGQNQSRMERQAPPAKTGAPTDSQGQFVAAVLGSTEDVWTEIFRANGQSYRAPKLRLYSGATSGGACGMAQSAMGPFYCPPDKRVFLDTSFFRDMEQKFRACTGKQCEFAQAYVMAHEIGHHVQNQLGILPRAMQLQQSAGSKAQANNIQVRVELQADCLAGVWANHAQRKKAFIDPGDVEGAIGIATAIGDDRLQKQATGRVVPDSFTHGSSEQRVRWFKVGFESGRVSSCDTFRTANL
jgi:predicted metalloprotease